MGLASLLSASRPRKSSSRKVQFKRSLIFESLEARSLMAAWVNQGPFSSTNGQVEGITNHPVTGAIHAVLAHPTNPDILYIGSINGGVWKTTNATSANPTWTTTTDSQSSNSISTLTFDSADATSQTVWAGNGRYSSYGRIGGNREGLLQTTNGGTSWNRVTGNGFLVGKNISGLAANGSNIVVAVNIADATANGTVGIFRSTTSGSAFLQINNAGATNGLPFGRAYDLVVDPLNPSIMYTSLALTPTATNAGIYKSINGGANWTRVSDSTMNALFTANTSNAELAAGRFGEVYASIINSGVVVGLFRSPDSGVTWTAMDLPKTNENGTDVGLNPGGPKGPTSGTPNEISGGQGSIHFSIVADPTNANIVYVGGDRQPRSDGDTGTFPNSIGANNFTGRLFRGDASQPAGSQFVHLTHSNTLGAPGGGTASNSAPHADSRDMTFDAAGNLVEVDDGGIYRRTNPRLNTGDWFSVNGNLSISEMHDVAYDSRSNTILAGLQDNGNVSQNTAGASQWNVVSQGDGGDVVIDEVSLSASNQSIRYTSAQNLGGLRKRIYNASGAQVSSTAPALTLVGGGAALVPAFRTPLQLNAVDPSRMIIQGSNSIYESLDQADNISEIGPGLGTSNLDQDAIVYGGKLNGVSNPDLLYVGSGTTISVRTTAGGPLSPTPVQPVTATIRDIVIDPDNYNSVALVTSTSVRWSTNAGTTWSNITGNLGGLTNEFRSLSFVPGIIGTLIVGTARGVFGSSLASLGQWVALGTGFPTVPAFEIEYDSTDNILVVGTLGRGAWTLSNATAEIDATIPPYDYGDAPASYLVTSAVNGPRHVRVGPTLGGTRDGEVDGLPTVNALGDDNNGGTDEDGYAVFSNMAPGFSVRLPVLAPQGGFLNMWLDTDRNGSFESSERFFADQALTIGTNNLFMTVPETAGVGSTFMRFRITEAAGQVTSPIGTAVNGEVEDHQATVYSPVVFGLSSSNVAENSPIGTPIGNFSFTGPGANTYTYGLIDGPGSTDNTAFSMVGDQLRLNTALNFETKSTYTIRVSAGDGEEFLFEKVFIINVTNVAEASVVGRRLFYNRSTSTVFGDGTGNPTTAIDTNRLALLPGQTATSSHYSNYIRGINGLVVDVANLVATPTASDFAFATWDGSAPAGFTPLAASPTVTVIPAGGSAGSTRLKIEFADNAVRNTWLRVTVLAGVGTDLAANDVFYFGNAVGDMFNVETVNPNIVRVNATDTGRVRQNQSPNPNSVNVDNLFDLNKDGRVNATDTGLVRQNQSPLVLTFFTAPLSLESASGGLEALLAGSLFDLSDLEQRPGLRVRARDYGTRDRSVAAIRSDEYFEQLGRAVEPN